MAQKLLLLEDVEALGRKGEIVSVRNGYARNYLFPQGFAITADARALRMQERLREERLKKAILDKQDSEKLASAMVEVTLTIPVKVDHEGHMYGSVTTADIVHLLQTEKGITLEKRFVQLPHPIKEVGSHTIKLKLKEGVAAEIVLNVVPEEAEEEKS